MKIPIALGPWGLGHARGIEVEVSVDRARLEATAAARKKHVWRARIILATAQGCGTAEILRRTKVAKACVWRWQAGFTTAGVDGLLHDKTRPARIPPLPKAVVETVVTRTLREPPPAGVTHWTRPAMAVVSGLSVSSVQRIWRTHGLRPHKYAASSSRAIPISTPRSRTSSGCPALR
jgi:hypothetical protein